jgi:pyruvate dehydrogenase E1 component alpha subunit
MLIGPSATKQEIEDYRNTKDPLQIFQNQLVYEKVLTDALIAEIDAAARAEADRAVEFAEASPFPTADDIQKDVYWETDQPQRTSEGRIFFNSVE